MTIARLQTSEEVALEQIEVQLARGGEGHVGLDLAGDETQLWCASSQALDQVDQGGGVIALQVEAYSMKMAEPGRLDDFVRGIVQGQAMGAARKGLAQALGGGSEFRRSQAQHQAVLG